MASQQHHFTLPDALAAIRRQPAGTHFYAHTRCELPIAGDDGKVFPALASVHISRAAALKLARDLLPESFARRSGLLPCGIYTSDTPESSYRGFYIG